MKRILLAATFGMVASLAQAAVTSDQVMGVLKQAGYTNVHVTTAAGRIKAEGTINGAQVEVVYDAATGKILSQSTQGAVTFDASGVTTGDSSGTSSDDVGDDNGGTTAGSDDSASDDAGDDNGGSSTNSSSKSSKSGKSGTTGKGSSHDSSDS
jgi:hypothetical protein